MKSTEDVKKYWDSRPCNASSSKKEKLSKEYFEETEIKKYITEPHIPEFAEFSKWSGKKVLEIGCGIGVDTVSFAKYGAQVTAVELSEESLKLARKRAELHGFKDKIRFYSGNAEELSKFVPIEKYDLIYSFGVIHHSETPEKILGEIKKYMHEKSILKIMIYYKYGFPALRLFIKKGHTVLWNYSKFLDKFHVGEIGCPIVRKYSKKSAKIFFKDFKIKKIAVDHIFIYERKKVKEGIYKKIWYLRMIPKYAFKKLEKIIGWHLLIEAGI